MPRSKTTGTEQTPEEVIVEIKEKNQQMTPEFVDLFIDVIYRMVIKIIEKEEK